MYVLAARFTALSFRLERDPCARTHTSNFSHLRRGTGRSASCSYREVRGRMSHEHDVNDACKMHRRSSQEHPNADQARGLCDTSRLLQPACRISVCCHPVVIHDLLHDQWDSRCPPHDLARWSGVAPIKGVDGDTPREDSHGQRLGESPAWWRVPRSVLASEASWSPISPGE